MSIRNIRALQQAVKDRVANPLYKTSAQYRKETEAMLIRMYGDQPYEIIKHPGGFKR